ncbi:MAG: hypothetical protein QOG87_1299 [Actinomycetota bacterium]|jgi:hypothetical protein
MFVQVIQGKTNDAEGFERQMNTWETELKPGAKGWLGTTGGIAPDGTTIAIVRFESEEAAKANSDRPEQSAWFEQLSKYYDGAPTFRNSTDVETVGNPSDDAGFVQVMIYEVKDRPALEALEKKVMPELMGSRPDIFGSFRVWDGSTAIDAIYFRSEAEARDGEKKMDAEMAEQMQQFAELGGEPTFIDLPNPTLRSA